MSNIKLNLTSESGIRLPGLEEVLKDLGLVLVGLAGTVVGVVLKKAGQQLAPGQEYAYQDAEAESNVYNIIGFYCLRRQFSNNRASRVSSIQLCL